MPADHQPELLSLVTARVRDAYLRKPVRIDGGLDVVSACRRMAELGLTAVLVSERDAPSDDERLGIFTTTDLRDALLRELPPQQLAVREVARFDLVSVDADADLFEAMWLMVRHRVHRLVVRDAAGEVLGLLGQLDLVSLVANHSHVAALQIDEAIDVDALQAAAARIDRMVALLHAGGIRVERLARMVGELNARLFERLWSLVAPPALVGASCLLVMGSEGRGEQLLKTDQDNALVLSDDLTIDDGVVEAACRDFSLALARLGYPPCPGDIMVINPSWRQREAGFRRAIAGWLHGADADSGAGPMRLAIFADARAVAGDATLLERLHAHLDTLLATGDIYLARFAAIADQLPDDAAGSGWWSRLAGRREEQPIDLKRAGIFPLVHGVRALALQQRIRATGSAERLDELVARGAVEPALARDLIDALRLLMGARLTHQLAQRAAGMPVDNLVRASGMALLEREPVLDALAVVKRFRAFLRQHFRLESLA